MKMSCEIIRDLLPSYAEGLTSEQSTAEIKKHLAECEDCSGLFAQMTAKDEIEFDNEEKEINYLKKIKNRNIKVIVIAVAVLLVILAIPFGWYSFNGMSDNAFAVDNIHVDSKTFGADILLLSSAKAITKVNVEDQDGVVTIDVRSALPFFHKNGEYALRLYEAAEEITKIQTADGQVVWETGEVINSKINDIYDAKVKYVGDNSAVANLLSAIDLNEMLKCDGYSIHLLTDKEPYGLEIYDINLYEEMFSSFSDESYENEMKGCAYLILACIENIDFVKFDYTAPNGDKKEYTLTVDEANESLGITDADKRKTTKQSIKDWSDSHWDLKILTDVVENQLNTSSQYEYKAFFEGTSEETVKILSNSPVDQKYSYILNNECADVVDETKCYVNWSRAYEKQYKIIYEAMLDYVRNNKEMDAGVQKQLMEDISAVKDYYQYSERVATLYHSVEGIQMGAGPGRSFTYAEKYLEESREKALRLAECAYLLNIDFEWVK